MEKPSRNKPASSLGMLRVTSAVNPNAIKAALSFAPAAKASFIRVAARPVASLCCTCVPLFRFLPRLWHPASLYLLHPCSRSRE